MVDDAGLRVRVLGPLRAEVGGRAVEVPGRSLRRLLLRLVLAGGGVVPDHTLLADVWDEDATLPVLHTAVARLRRALEPGRGDHAPGRIVVRDGDGYSVRLAVDGVDADRFAAGSRRGGALLGAGRVHEARTALEAAAAEWVGPPFVDAAGRAFAVAERDRLDAMRIEVEELRLEAAARLGDPVAVPALTSFVADHPERERAVELLVRALCAGQRAPEALGVLRRARAVAIETTGSELGPALQALQRAVLRNDPTLTAPRRPPVPRRLLATTNLPAPVSSFVGRVVDRQEVDRRLAGARLLVLTGPGGVGKTRLALEVARARHDHDGPWFVDLADVRDPGLLAERTARALGLGGTGTVDALAAALQDRAALLLLDNCEQLAGEVGAFATMLLARCPALSVLATTREPLGVPGEEVLPVAPLSSGVDGDGVRLFLARSAEASNRPRRAERPEDAAELCDELDGLPLAIELAAARSDALSIVDLRRGLADRFALLRRDGRAGRHATMLAAVEWTYRMLDGDEREVYEALAVFHGGFRLDAAEAVAGRPDTALLVARLVARSIVTVEEGPQRRYRLLETLRAHAERVTPPERHRVLVQRHLDWVRGLASSADAALRGRLSSTATTALQDEASNIRAALDVADPATVLRIGGGFYWFWYREGLTEEGLGHLVPAIAATSGAGGALDLSDRCRAGMGVALLSYLRGDLAAVQAALEQAGRDADRCGDTKVTTQYLSTVAYFEAGGGLIDAAREHAIRSLRLARSTADRGAAAESLMVLGEVDRRSGRLEEAAAALSDAVEEARACGYTWAATSSLWILSKVELEAGRVESARRTAVASATGSHREHETTSWIVGLITVAHLDLLLGRAERSALIAGAADWLGTRIGFQPAAMDGDLARWTAELTDEHRRTDLADAVSRGRRLTTEQLLALLEGGTAESQVVPGAEPGALGPTQVRLP